MDHEYRGIVLIFNHFKYDAFETTNENRIKVNLKDRSGTEHDVSALKESLPKLGFEKNHIFVYDDLTYDQIIKTVKDLNKKTENTCDILKNSDCIMVFILTHGKDDNMLWAYDRDYKIHDFIELFTPNSIEELAIKPKLFFIQACRGDTVDKGKVITHDTIDHGYVKEVKTFTHPSFADLSIAYSSHQGHISFRSATHGSWFIQELCNVIKDNENHELYDILIMTNAKVAGRSSTTVDQKFNNKKQVSTFYQSLTKKVTFTQK